MNEKVKLNELDDVLGELDYPLSRGAVTTACADVTLLLADGHENLGALLERSHEDTFESQDDLLNEILGLLPQHAVGEPYQSEGEG
ncbi:hypothetical protein [Haladaptatus sp. DJG-WS-42]|uniref:DUF5789 family protein n=1 Tax=Haladaptatus sp. DJG-WS-42 TaxID=3120516 RepID=UPI0030D1FBB3